MAGAELLYQRDEYLITLALFLFLVALAYGGYFWGRHRRSRYGGSARSQLSIVQSSVLGILALLLGFTFSMAISRYEVRVSMVVVESNAIGTTSRRARMLPEPYRQGATAALRRYLDTRIKIHNELDLKATRDEETKAQALQNQSWSIAVSAAQQDPHSIPTGLFIATLNEAIDAQARRDAARRNHVPESALVLLMLVAACAMGLVGFGYGSNDEPPMGQPFPIAAVIALVIFIIIDLDRPSRGFIHVGQRSMIALAESMRSTDP